MTLIDIIKKLPLKPTVDYGNLILLSDIFKACKLYGQNDQHYIEAILKELESQGRIEIIHMNNAGFEDLIIGVKIKN